MCSALIMADFLREENSSFNRIFVQLSVTKVRDTVKDESEDFQFILTRMTQLRFFPSNWCDNIDMPLLFRGFSSSHPYLSPHCVYKRVLCL